MKYYSELTKKFYDSEKECKEAEEFQIQKKKEEEELAAKKSRERKARADEVEAAWNKALEAQKEYSALVSKFVKDYGSYHKTFSNLDDKDFDWFGPFFI